MSYPCVLLSTAYGAERNYIEAFNFHGFMPTAQYLPDDTGFDALVLCGGGDIAPDFYGEQNCGSNPPDICRDKAEFSIFERYYSQGKPVFGICRGCQLINVALGGSLVQHLPTFIEHTQHEDYDSIHKVINVMHSEFEMFFGKEMTVNSSHHQACARIGEGIDVIQRHCDGTVEAISGKSILAFQWHPERMTATYFQKDFSDPSKIFEIIKKRIN